MVRRRFARSSEQGVREGRIAALRTVTIGTDPVEALRQTTEKLPRALRERILAQGGAAVAALVRVLEGGAQKARRSR
jgi:hypothetical protein